MKFRLIYLRHFLLAIIIFICYQQQATSQQNVIGRWKQPGLYFGLSLRQSQNYIINDVTIYGSEINSSKQVSFSGSLEIGYLFSEYFGLSSGIGYIPYKTQLTLNSYQNHFTTTDEENETYERQITGSDIKELQEVGFLSIPVCAVIHIPLNNKMGFFLQTGAGISLPLSKNYKSTGTFTYKGYFPAYNVVLENLPDFGFPSQTSSNSDGNLELKPISYNVIASAGVDFLIQKKIQIVVAACYDKSLTSISKSASPNNFQLSTDAGQINSLMSGSSNPGVQSMGLKITLVYYMNDYKKFKYSPPSHSRSSQGSRRQRIKYAH